VVVEVAEPWARGHGAWVYESKTQAEDVHRGARLGLQPGLQPGVRIISYSEVSRVVT
jgi:hypothetical protein